MKRREFIRLLGVAASWPMTALAQAPSKPVVGFVHARSRDDTLPLVAAFRQGLAETFLISYALRFGAAWGRLICIAAVIFTPTASLAARNGAAARCAYRAVVAACL